MLRRVLCLLLIASGCQNLHHVSHSTANRELAKRILSDPSLDRDLQRAKALLKNGFNAGSTYSEIWIRDFATFMTVSCQVNDPRPIRASLLMLARFQREDGNIPDGIGKTKSPATQSATAQPVLSTQITLAREIITNSADPDHRGFKNSVETDQETSFVQAVKRYIDATGDTLILDDDVDGQSLRTRLERAMDFLLEHRFSREHGLLFGATTIDWGDIAPEDRIGAVFNDQSHRAIDIYDNAMFVLAIDDFVTFFPEDSSVVAKWKSIAADVRGNIRRHLWDAKRQKFIPHVYLDGSPFLAEFDEASIYYFGGTAVAIEAGLLNQEEIVRCLADLRTAARAAGAKTLGLTNYPVYPKGLFLNPHVDPWTYQNGGDWDWFGARLVAALATHGFANDAYAELQPILARVERHDGFYEWFDMQDVPRGSKTFKGSAGQIANAITALQAWAHAQLNEPE